MQPTRNVIVCLIGVRGKCGACVRGASVAFHPRERGRDYWGSKCKEDGEILRRSDVRSQERDTWSWITATSPQRPDQKLRDESLSAAAL